MARGIEIHHGNQTTVRASRNARCFHQIVLPIAIAIRLMQLPTGTEAAIETDEILIRPRSGGYLAREPGRSDSHSDSAFNALSLDGTPQKSHRFVIGIGEVTAAEFNLA
jgi:hypothetical protein